MCRSDTCSPAQTLSTAPFCGLQSDQLDASQVDPAKKAGLECNEGVATWLHQSVRTLFVVLDSKMATVGYDAAADPEMDSLSDEELERYFKNPDASVSYMTFKRIDILSE